VGKTFDPAYEAGTAAESLRDPFVALTVCSQLENSLLERATRSRRTIVRSGNLGPADDALDVLRAPSEPFGDFLHRDPTIPHGEDATLYGSELFHVRPFTVHCTARGTLATVRSPSCLAAQAIQGASVGSQPVTSPSSSASSDARS